MYGCEIWTIKKAEHQRIDALELWCWRRLFRESLGLQGDQIISPQGNQSWVFIWGTDNEAETPILWPPDAKNWLTGKDADAGKDWRQEEKGMTEEEMVGWHYQLDGHEFEQAPGVGDGQESLVCCSPQGRKESDTTEGLNWMDWRPWWWALTQCDWWPFKGRTAHRERQQGNTQGKSTKWKGSKRAAICKPRGEASEKRTLSVPWSWTFILQNSEKISFCCLSQPVSGTLFWQL